jgi:hypothetical protein
MTRCERRRHDLAVPRAAAGPSASSCRRRPGPDVGSMIPPVSDSGAFSRERLPVARHRDDVSYLVTTLAPFPSVGRWWNHTGVAPQEREPFVGTRLQGSMSVRSMSLSCTAGPSSAFSVEENETRSNQRIGGWLTDQQFRPMLAQRGVVLMDSPRHLFGYGGTGRHANLDRLGATCASRSTQRARSRACRRGTTRSAAWIPKDRGDRSRSEELITVPPPPG